MRFQGKSVIVTGGASGIGAATVKLFIDEGASVIIADTNSEGQSLAEELNQHDQRATFVQTDVSKADQKLGKI